MAGTTNPDNRLSLRGTKTFGISVGSKHSPAFDQSMQIKLDGNLSPGIYAEGTLRDDGVPIDPEGTTQELKEMDEIYLHLRTPKNELRLGDFDLSLSHSKFGELRRKQEGILIRRTPSPEPRTPTPQTLLSAALSKGKWTHREFEGTAGKQGPYELSSQVIVSGSERVWVNGKLKTRGEDYTISYSQATLTFTPKLPIEDRDRIHIEFQQKDESYRRTSLLMTHESRTTTHDYEASLFRVLLFKEDDINNSPLSFTLTPERMESFSSASARDSSFIWISGATPSDKGSYIKLANTEIYEYVGYPNGDYDVSFSQVLEGDYDFDALIGGYYYVGEGSGSPRNGSYIPQIRVPLPQSNSLLSIGYGKNISLRGEPLNSQLKFDIEGGVTKFNPNTFNPEASLTEEQLGKALIGELSIGNYQSQSKNSQQSIVNSQQSTVSSQQSTVNSHTE